jgi:hypothetical protein
MYRLLRSPDTTNPPGGIPPLVEVKPIQTVESPELRKLGSDLVEVGFMLGETVKKIEKLGRPANILLSGPSASKKSTILGILRHLAESSGFQSEKAKEGKKSTLMNPKGTNDLLEPAEGTQIVFWESTTILPPRNGEIDFYLEIEGTPGARLSRLSEKTGSYEFALQVVETSTKGQRTEGVTPNMIVNTDPITLELEHSGWVTRKLQEGWRKSFEGSGIPAPTNEENTALQEKITLLKNIGLDKHLNPGQMEFIAVRLRPESIIALKDGRKAAYVPRINLIIGEKFTGNIPLKEIGVREPPEATSDENTQFAPGFMPTTSHTFYVISDGPSARKMADVSAPNSWVTTGE